MNVKAFNLLSQPKITIANGLTQYIWEDFQVPAVVSNDHEAKWVNNFARVQVSDYNSWADVVNWGLAINPLQTSFSGELADTVASLKKRFGTDKEKYFRAAVSLVQDEVRYMGIETGQYSHKANNPNKVFSKRYGDCKDKSLLIASILNAGGIEAHLVLINTDLQDKLENFLPSSALFNHAVVVATIKGKQFFVDATIANQGGNGTDIYFPPYGDGLILKPGNNGLTNIQETPAGKTICEERYQITDEYLPVVFTVKTTYTLDQADYIRNQIATNGMAQTEKSYLDYYSKTYNKIKATDSISVKDNKAKNELTTIEHYKIENFFKHDAVKGKFTADFYADFISEQLPQIGGQVKNPVSVEYPFDIDYTTLVTMSNGWDMENEHYTLNRDDYKFSYDKTITDNTLSLHYKFKYLKNYIPQGKLPEFRQDIKDLKDDKLWYSFYYVPDIKIVPFQVNKLLLLITILVIGLFVFGGLKIYKTDTRRVNLNNSRNVFRPELGGWLIVLIIVLCATPISIINNLIRDSYFSMSKWDLVTTGIKSTMNRILLTFETVGYIALTCYSIFCVVLIFKRRDISPRIIKLYYIVMVSFLFTDYFFDAFVNSEFSNYMGEQIFKAVVVGILWTYYLNTSERVKNTFIIGYPN